MATKTLVNLCGGSGKLQIVRLGIDTLPLKENQKNFLDDTLDGRIWKMTSCRLLDTIQFLSLMKGTADTTVFLLTKSVGNQFSEDRSMTGLYSQVVFSTKHKRLYQPHKSSLTYSTAHLSNTVDLIEVQCCT